MLLWFRNDLRSHDNPALQYVLAQCKLDKPITAIFFITHKQWQQHDWSARKINFIERHANALVSELASFNIMLKLVTVDSFAEQISYLVSYCQNNQINEIVANSEVELNETLRDDALQAAGVKLTLFEADVIVPKGKILTKSGEMFKVFTPFKQAWLSYVKALGFDYLGKLTEKDEQACLYSENDTSLTSAWPLAKDYERDVLPAFLAEKLEQYADKRDFPAIKGTAGISPYLAAGVISPRYILRLLLTKYPDLLSSPNAEAFSWLNELIWREFYRHLLFHHPKLCKHDSFKSQYQSLPWLNDALAFKAWQQGRTGYPLVDAAMRQLNSTGWMHNRLRMIVASFLTKHLLIDWRWGEQYFMQQLIDGDLAANNGGWQWAASTGCDAQPYFRIFNPIRQSERFDPNGDFIRTYLPELANIPIKDIHFPHDYIAKHGLRQYWPAIVDHKAARLRALAFFKAT